MNTKKVNLVYFLIFCVGLFVLNACSSTKFTGETRYFKDVKFGQLSIISGGYGKFKKEAANNAIENAFKTIFLYGVPNTNQSSPLLGKNAQSVFDSNKSFFENFLLKEKEQFVQTKHIRGFKFTNGKSPSVEVELLINLKALRTHLEENKIIRKFGL